MKKKKFLSVLITLLMIFSPMFFLSMKVHAADDDNVYTVILKSGKGTGNDVIIKSTDSGVMAKSEASAKSSQFFVENNATYFCTPLSAPKTFQAPTDKKYSFSGWASENGEFLHDEDVKMNDCDNNTLVLTALWNDSFFKLAASDTIEIKGPGYTDFTYTLESLHLGKTDLGSGNKLIVDNVEVEFTSGTLEIDGKTIPYMICPTYGNPGKKAISEQFTENDIGKEFKMSIYISEEDYKKIQPGIHKTTLTLNCTGIYTCHPYSSKNPDGHSPNYIFETKKFRGNTVALKLPLTLVVSHSSADESTSTLNANNSEVAEKVDNPSTGDSANAIPLVMMVTISICGFTTAITCKNKKRKL
ncbi:MAG: hypothetical protein Q4D57_02500 [Clostridia bacterium]|nr:hypothetical protein [Clostridia bacterium]